jgi:hypothetical protein
MAPFGSLLAGVLAHRIGAPNTLLIGGIACVAGAVLCARNIPAFKKQGSRVQGLEGSRD